jgi:AraC-like DNA-binding protein
MHTLCDETMSYSLNALSSSIASNPAKCREKIIIPNDVPLKLINLQIQKGKYRSKAICDIEKLPEAIYKLFEDLEGLEAFLYMGNYNMHIGDCIDQLIDNQSNPLLEITLKEGKTLELLSLLFNQYAKDLDPAIQSTRIKEIYRDKILEAEKILLHDLQNTPTIPDLAKQLGINQQKLKQGFKKVFGMPIAKYTAKRKMEYARLLILETEQSIGDIAFTVGYKNHSQFSKRFKSVYGFLPKTLRRNRDIEKEIKIGKQINGTISVA